MTINKKILTITLNPSIDISYKVEDFSTGEVHRVKEVSKAAGGKGLNVSSVGQTLGLDIHATGFLGGTNGQFIRETVQSKGIRHDFVDVPINTRNCINIVSNGVHTELLEESETVPPEYGNQLLSKIKSHEDIEFAVISGSLVKGLSSNIYAEIIQLLNQKGIKVIVDVNATILADILEHNLEIFMIKPNAEEAESYFGSQISLPEQVKQLVVSLGSEGLKSWSNNGVKAVKVPKIEVQNTVGSGDASIAGFIKGYLDGNGDLDSALRSMAAAGTANALQEGTGFIDKNDYNKLLKRVSVTEI